MAVDTRAKRSSILGFTLASLVALPLPDTSVDTVDRVGLAYSYSGTDFSVSAFTGTATSDINAISQSGTGTFPYIGAATSDINAIAQSGTGTNYDNFTGTATSDINAVGQSATGTGPGVVEVAPAGAGAGGGGEPDDRRKPRGRKVENTIGDGLFDGFKPYEEPKAPEKPPEKPFEEPQKEPPAANGKPSSLSDLGKRRERREREKALKAQKAEDAAKLLAVLEADNLESIRLQDEEDVRLLMDAAKLRRALVAQHLQGRANGK